MKIINESVNDHGKLFEKIQNAENEIVEIKNERRALSNLKQKVHWASDASTKLEAIIEEANNLYSFIQKYIDESAVDRIK